MNGNLKSPWINVVIKVEELYEDVGVLGGP